MAKNTGYSRFDKPPPTRVNKAGKRVPAKAPGKSLATKVVEAVRDFDPFTHPPGKQTNAPKPKAKPLGGPNWKSVKFPKK